MSAEGPCILSLWTCVTGTGILQFQPVDMAYKPGFLLETNNMLKLGWSEEGLFTKVYLQRSGIEKSLRLSHENVELVTHSYSKSKNTKGRSSYWNWKGEWSSGICLDKWPSKNSTGSPSGTSREVNSFLVLFSTEKLRGTAALVAFVNTPPSAI